MAEKVAELYADFSIRTGNFDKNLKGAKKKVGKMDDAIKKLGVTIAATFGARVFVDFAKDAVMAASALEEATGKFNTVFASTVLDMELSVLKLQEAYAMSEREAKQYLSSIQDLLVPMGLNADLSAALSEEVVKLSADLGSFNNLPTAQVMADIQSALVGNFETTKKYGVILNETVIRERARKEGIIKGTEAISASAKAQLALKIITESSSFAVGDMERTQDSFANQLKRSQARVEDFNAALGQQLTRSLSEAMVSMDLTAKGAKRLGASLGNVVAILARTATAIAKVISLLTGFGATMSAIAEIQEDLDELNTGYLTGAKKGFTDLGKIIENESEKALLLQAKITNDAIQKSKKRKKIVEIENQEKSESWKQYYAKIYQAGLNALSGVASLASQTSQVLQMATNNDIAALDNKQQKRQDQIDKEYEAEKIRIENLVISEEDKNLQLKSLDEQRARDSESALNKFEKKKRKIQRDAAKTQKKLAIFETALTIPSMAVQSYKALAGIPVVGPALGTAAAIAATALGIAKLTMIKNQPLPALAAGGVVSASAGGTQAIIGEGGKDELIAPLTKDVFLDFARGLVGAIKEDQTPEASIVDNSQSGPMMIHNVINFGSREIYNDITEAISNKEILVDGGAVVAT